MSLKTIAVASTAVLTLFVLHCAAPLGGSESNIHGNDPDDTSSTDGGNVGTTANGLPCDVDKLLKERCQACHGKEPSAGASTSLTSFDDLQKERNEKKLWQLVKERIHAEDRPMPPSPRLKPEELETFDAWLEGGPKKSTESCEATGPVGTPPLECDGEKSVLKAGAPFVMDGAGGMDQYVCFGVDVEHGEKRHLTAFGPKVDNAQILHHILVFQADSAMDATPAPCDPVRTAGWTLVGGWAPGGQNKAMPPEAGFPEEPGVTHYAVQLHYNNARGLEGAKDNSGMELCTTDKLRPNDAAVVGFGAMNLGPKKPINIPPRKTNHTVSCNYTWRHDAVTFFSASPHMHKLGRALKSETTSGRVLADEPKFDFEQQIGGKIDSNVKKGEVVKTTCVWTNTSDKTVTFGEGTDDEMCFNFLAYYPKIDGLAWVMPSLASNCEIE